MNDAIDSVEINNQPHREVNIYMYLYFVSFIIFGSFFTLNLLVGVIIDKFSRLRAEYDGSALQTEEQQQWTNMQRILQAIQPHVYLEEPEHPVRRVAFRIARHKWFNHFITTCIVVNTVIMCMNHDRESSLYVLVQAIESADVCYPGLRAPLARSSGSAPSVHACDCECLCVCGCV